VVATPDPNVTLDFDLSGIVLRLEDVPRTSAATLRRELCVYAASPASRPFLHLGVGRGAAPPPRAAFAPKSMRSELSADGAVFFMPEGRAEIALSGAGKIELARGLGDREYFTLMNLVRSCLAWMLPSRGGALLHAAGLVIEDRGFVLVGAEGTGKSTWARLGEEAGGKVVSDDLVLLDPAHGGYDLLGAPFRSTHRTTMLKGRWPLAAVLFPDHGDRPKLEPVPALLAKARIAANLTFIADAVECDERVPALIERLHRSVPCAELTFAPEIGFVELLRKWPGPMSA
jgi:hypothetical protein